MERRGPVDADYKGRLDELAKKVDELRGYL